jgi:hypothetical protein
MVHLAVIGIYVGGVLHVGFAVFHLFFWKLFRWREELPKLAPLNRQIVQVLNISLVVGFLGVAYISLGYAGALAGTAAGKATCFAIAAFWLARLVQQFMFFDMKRPASWGLAAAMLVLTAFYALPIFV